MSRSDLFAPPSQDAHRPVAPRAALPVIGMILGFRPATVLDVRPETPTIRVLRLAPPEGYKHRAGQHAGLRLETPDGPDLRPLSIASPPGTGVIEFATRISSSSFKRAFAGLRPGDAVRVSRPFGGLRLQSGVPAIMVAGGIGITPVRSLLSAASLNGHQDPIRLLYANRTADEIPFRTELDALVPELPDLRISWLVSAQVGDAPSGVVAGHIDADLLDRHLRELPDAVVYVTGPAGMVTDVRATLRRLGVARSRIRATKQTMPGTGAPRARR